MNVTQNINDDWEISTPAQDDIADPLRRKIPGNSLDFILGLPISSLPGEQFHYNDGNPSFGYFWWMDESRGKLDKTINR